MKKIAIIPARFESSRFPGKPLAIIEGKPLVWWVYQNALAVDDFSEILVATDDIRIKEVCDKYMMNVVMTSKQHATGTDRLAEVAAKVSADLYFDVQGDEPLLLPETIMAAITPFENDSNIMVTNLMTKIIRLGDIINSTVPKVVINDKQEAIYFSRSPVPYPKSNIKIAYMKQVCVYGFRPEALRMFSQTPKGNLERAEDIELLRFIENGYKIRMVEVGQDTVAVDTPSDLEIVRGIIKNKVGVMK